MSVCASVAAVVVDRCPAAGRLRGGGSYACLWLDLAAGGFSMAASGM